MGRIYRDYTGRVFGELTVVGFAGRDKKGRSLWRCSCACGGEITTLANALNTGDTISCGHLRRDRSVLGLPLISTYGRPVRHPLYAVWNNMINRCYNAKAKNYKDYGGRGIRVCRRWHFYANFYDDTVELWEEGLQIDREDNNKGYYPANVRFVTRKVNANNTRATERTSARRKNVAKLVLQKLRRLRGRE